MSTATTTTNMIPVIPPTKNEEKVVKNAMGMNESAFTANNLISSLSSPNAMPINAMSFWNTMQSPLMNDASFAFNSFPTTPTNQQFSNTLFPPNNNNQPALIQPIMMNNNNLSHIANNLMNPSMLYLQTPANVNSFEQQLQSMMGGINGMNHFGIASIEDIPCTNSNSMNQQNVNLSTKDNKMKEGLVIKTKHGKKRKIKQEDEKGNFGMLEPRKKKKRGRKRKVTHLKDEDRDDLELLSERMRQRNEKLLANDSINGFIGFRTKDGELRIPIPAKVEVEYELFGDACTDRIEDILQAKGRTRYVRGLSEREKKDRRREQNRNAAARSRARKNAMISKVIQLHQENLSLRAHTARTISTIKQLKEEVELLQRMTEKKE